MGDLIADSDDGFSLLQTSTPVPGPIQSAIQGLLRIPSTGMKLLRHEADHSTPSTAYVKNDWSCTFTFPVCLTGEHGDFTFLYFTVQCTNRRDLHYIGMFGGKRIWKEVVVICFNPLKTKRICFI
jgi:hypothetical protein